VNSTAVCVNCVQYFQASVHTPSVGGNYSWATVNKLYWRSHDSRHDSWPMLAIYQVTHMH